MIQGVLKAIGDWFNPKLRNIEEGLGYHGEGSVKGDIGDIQTIIRLINEDYEFESSKELYAEQINKVTGL